MTSSFMGHQGDVFFMQIDDSYDWGLNEIKREKVQRAADGTLTLVEGEATHHHHLFPKEADVEAFYMGEMDGVKMYEVVINNPTDFHHLNVKTGLLTKEHSSIKLNPGRYRFSTQREYNGEGIFPVVD